jgi:hypothetical protein
VQSRNGTCNLPDLSEDLLIDLVREGKLLPADTVFMQQQMPAATSFRLRASLLPGYQVVPADSLWAIRRRLPRGQRFQLGQMMQSRYKTDDFFYLSMPLFSRDRQTVIVSISYSDGSMDEAGSTFALHREQKRWRIVKKHADWIS